MARPTPSLLSSLIQYTVISPPTYAYKQHSWSRNCCVAVSEQEMCGSQFQSYGFFPFVSRSGLVAGYWNLAPETSTLVPLPVDCIIGRGPYCITVLSIPIISTYDVHTSHFDIYLHPLKLQVVCAIMSVASGGGGNGYIPDLHQCSLRANRQDCISLGLPVGHESRFA